MNCEQVQPLLVSYLNHETTPSERALIRAHVSGCAACEQEIARLSAVQDQVRSALQRRAAHAVPSPEAWNRLEAKLAKVAQPSPDRFGKWLSRLAPGVSHLVTQLFLGGVTMRNRLVFTTLATVALAIAAAVFMTKTATPVSAKEILQQAYTVQAAANPTQGIDHIRSELYSNPEALPESQGQTRIIESYNDLESGNYRIVTTDSQNGKVVSVYAQDGSNTYTSEGDKAGLGTTSNAPLIIYRTPQDIANVGIQKRLQSSERLEAKNIFDRMYNAPEVQFLGQETWENGRTVYVLKSQQEVKVMEKDEIARPIGWVTIYFDVNTYEMLGNQVTVEKDGEEIVVSSQRTLTDEILPAETNVAWDLSDLQGVNLVDDTQDEHSLPEVISLEELLATAPTPYLLKTVPDGFSLEITAFLKPWGAGKPYFYNATYRQEAEYFSVRVWGIPVKDADWVKEIYTTANGLVMYLLTERGGEWTSAQVVTPEGLTLAVTSTFPPETFKAWSEELVLAK
jgi:anti-sigma factor RsiW